MWRIEKNIINGQNEIVIDGFEQGIADAAYEGIADMRNANITSSPRQASVQFATDAITLPPTGYTGVAFTANDTDDVITTATTSGFYKGMAVLVVTVSGSAGLTAGTTYYAKDVTATTFKLSKDISAVGTVDITSDITGTFTVPTFGIPIDSVSASIGSTVSVTNRPSAAIANNFVMTSEGYVWRITRFTGSDPTNDTAQFMGNTGHSTAGTFNAGLAVFGGGTSSNFYLFAFMSSEIDYINLDIFSSTDNPSEEWVYAWQSTSSSPQGHRALWATDDTMYFCNSDSVGSVLINAGQTFDPTNSATYTYNADALQLPYWDRASCLSQLGINLLVGGTGNYIYPWDRVSPTFSYPIVCAEQNIFNIVATNENAYVFAGFRGRIYITNGANIELFKKFPDSLAGVQDPYYLWGWSIYWRNQLYFSIEAQDNNRTAISNFAGVWAIDLDSGALRLTNSLSYGSYAGSVPTLMPQGFYRPPGDGLFIGWVNGSGTGGIDRTSVDPYDDYETYIDTDIIPIGTFLTKNTFSNIEFKLGKPLVSGEKVKLSYRTNLTDSFTQIGETTTAGVLSDLYTMNFEGIQWLQIRANTSSTATTPSYTLLREIRFR